MYLPLVISPESEVEAHATSIRSLDGHETVLVVDDDDALRSLTARLLEQRGYTVVPAGDAAEALELLTTREGPVDLLLTDVVLSGEAQGDDLARMVTSLRPDLPVLYMSGYPRDAIVHAGRLDEGVNYLEKPFTPDGLARRVREVLDSQRPRGANAGSNGMR